MTVEVPIRIHGAPNLREHWAARAKRVKQERASVGWFLRAIKKPALPCAVTLTRIAPRSLDGDNLQAGCKAARDEIAAWLGVDDADPRVTWRYAQEPRPKTYALRVTVEPM